MWKKAAFTGLFLLLIVLSTMPVLAAGDTVLDITPAAAQVTGVLNKNELTTTLTITPQQAGLTQVSFRLDAPMRETTGVARYLTELKSSNLDFTPDIITDPVKDLGSQVEIKADNITEAGTWVGSLTIEYRGAYTGTTSIPITITVHTVPVLSVVETGTLLVQGVRGADAPLTRTLTLQETSGGDAVTGIDIKDQGFLDEKKVNEPPAGFFEGRMQTGDEILRSDSGTALLAFHLGNVPSGRYSGKLVLKSQNAQPVLVDATIEVKDGPGLAVAWLVVGIVTGIVLTFYRSSVMPKDQVRVRMQIVQDRLKDEDFKRYFEIKINELFVKAAGYLREDKTREAGDAMTEAEQLWDGWYHNRDLLVKLLVAAQEILDQLKAVGQGFSGQPPAAELVKDIQNLLDSQVPDYVTRVNDLAAKITGPDAGWQELASRLPALYRSLADLAEDLQSHQDELEPGQYTQLSQALSALQEKFKVLSQPLQVKDVVGLQQEVKTFHSQVKEAYQQAEAHKGRYAACASQAGAWLEGLTSRTDSVGSAARLISEIILRNADQSSSRSEWALAAQTAHNAFFGAQAVLFLDTSIQFHQNSTDEKWNAVREEENKLVALLVDRANYNLEPKQVDTLFFTQAHALQDVLIAVLQQPVELNWLETPPGSVRGWDDLAALSARFLRPLQDRLDLAILPIPSGAGKSRRFIWPWEPHFWSPGRRLGAVNGFTFVLGVGLLAVFGFDELYTKVSTFGVNGWMDYTKLFLWGFGAEAGRAQVVGLVKGWNIITPRTD